MRMYRKKTAKDYAEDNVQKHIAQWLRVKGYLFTSIPAGLIVSAVAQRTANRLGYTKGAPDIIAWIPNGTVSIEVKRPEKRELSLKTGKMVIANPKGVQTPEQKEFQERVQKTPGHHYIVAYDVYDVEKYFEKIGDNNDNRN